MWLVNMNGARALVLSLRREGVEVVFGLPGIQIMSVFDALYDEPGIRVVTVRHEQAATYMADGYARTTGKVAAALVVPGPGVLNALAGLGTAYSASSPVLLVAGQVPSGYVNSRRGALHEVDDQLEVVRPLTKWCTRIMRPGEVPSAVRTAMRNLRSGRPRPVALEIPWDILTASGDVELVDPAPRAGPKQMPAPMVEEAAALLCRASRPLILAGGGVNLSGASSELRELAEALNAPVITTPEGKGSIPEDHRLALGAVFYKHGPARHALPMADVVLVVGSRLFLQPWGLSLREDQKVIQVDIDREEIGRNFPAAVAINSDAMEALRALILALRGKPACSEWTTKELAGIRGEVRRELRGVAPKQLAMIESLRSSLDDDAIIVAGVTNVSYWAFVAFKALRPRTFITPSYFGTLGYAFPTAVGVKIGNPDRQVVALCGDGGFMFSSQELATAVRERANLVTVVFNDSAYGSSLSDQLRNFEGRAIGTRLTNPDFVRLAEAYGAKGIRLSSLKGLAPALKRALKQRLPTVVEVRIPTLVPPYDKKLNAS